MSKKRILFSAYAFFPEFGGLEQQIYLLAQEYLKMGYDVDVLTEKSQKSDTSYEEINGIHVYRLPYAKERSLISYVSLIYNLSRFVITNRERYSFIILRAALTLYPLIFGFWKKVGVLQTKTWVTADTGGEKDEIISVKKWPFNGLMIYIFSAHDYLNSICEANYRHYIKLGFDKDKLTRISNGVDISRFTQSKYPKKVNNFLFLGRLIEEKGIYELLKAFTMFHIKNPKAKLYIGGDGAEKRGILKYIKQEGLTNVIIYKGFINNDSINAFYDLGECLVQPSYSEGFGLVYAEAAVRKKVIIATDVADLKKDYGSMIFFCEKRKIEDLYQTLNAVYEIESFDTLDYSKIIARIDIKSVARQIIKLAE